MERGYVRTYRKILDSGLLRNHALFAFKMWCILRASWKGQTVWMNGQKVEVGPGEFLFGRDVVCDALRLTPRRVRTLTSTCLKCGFITTIKSTSKYTVFKVVNWDIYQTDPDENDQHNDHQNDQQATSKRPASDHIQEGKKVRRKEEDQKPKPLGEKRSRVPANVPPLIEALRLGMGRYPAKQTWPAIEAQVNGTQVDLAEVTRYAAEWIAHGWKPTNFVGALKYALNEGRRPTDYVDDLAQL